MMARFSVCYTQGIRRGRLHRALTSQVPNLTPKSQNLYQSSLENMVTFFLFDGLDVVVVDSVAPLVLRAVLEGEMGDA